MQDRTDQPDPNVRYDAGGWISGPSLTADEMAAANTRRNLPHGMTSEEATDLFQLRCTWDKYYGIAFSDDVWKAHRLGAGAPWNITADTAEELRGLIWADYSAWQAEGGAS